MGAKRLMIHALKTGSILVLLIGLVSCAESSSEDEMWNGDEVSWLFNIKTPLDSMLTGDAFANSIQALEIEQRESVIYTQITQGNIPDFLRSAVPIQYNMTIQDSAYQVTFYVMPDYLSIGNNSNSFLIPMTPILAQRVMDQVGGILPTRKMVNLIWDAAEVKLQPAPIAPSPEMVTVPVFDQHNKMVQNSRDAELEGNPLGALVSGHKKDVILSNRISTSPNKVIIYGWHYTTGVAIQPLYSGHVIWYADYSHGIRAVLASCQVNGQIMKITDILSDSLLYQLLSDEPEPMKIMRYDTSTSSYQ